jgi:hypothetical protein
MTRRCCLAAALAVVLGAGSAFAQYDIPVGGTPRSPAARGEDDPKPVYKYELKPEHPEYLVFVKAYQAPAAADRKGEARELAEGLAEYIRSECKLYAFVHERGWLQRRERDKEKETVIKAIRDYYKNLPEEQIQVIIKREVKLARIPDEYGVFVAPGKGTLKSFDEAREFAKYVHKLPSPPARYCDAVFIGAEHDIARKEGARTNPFEQGMPCRNPTWPKKDQTSGVSKEDVALLKGLNAGQPYSLMDHTRKPVTLVVKTYSGQSGRVFTQGEVLQTGGKSEGEMLEVAAHQAISLAETLRREKYDAYVMHTKFESFVCIGEYDSKDDERLLAAKRTFAGMQLKDQKTGTVIETLMEKPIPAAIPRQ